MLKLLSGLTGGVWLYLAIFLGGAVCGGTATHKIDANHYNAKIYEGQVQLSQAQVKYDHDMGEIKAAQQKQAEDALIDQQNRQHQLAALDAQHLQEMKNAQDANDKLRRDVANGNVRLRIAVQAAGRNTHACGAETAAPAAPASVDDAAVDLAPEARQAYFDLRDSITQDANKISGLQDYVNKVCQPAQ